MKSSVPEFFQVVRSECYVEYIKCLVIIPYVIFLRESIMPFDKKKLHHTRNGWQTLKKLTTVFVIDRALPTWKSRHKKKNYIRAS